jgi:transposase-like protein
LESPLPSKAGRRRLITWFDAGTPWQIIRKLRAADRLLAEGAEVADVARHLGVSEQTCHRRRNQFGVRKADDAKRLLEVGPALQQATRYVMVDEFQDTNSIQERLLDRLSEGHGKLASWATRVRGALPVARRHSEEHPPVPGDPSGARRRSG